MPDDRFFILVQPRKGNENGRVVNESKTSACRCTDRQGAGSIEAGVCMMHRRRARHAQQPDSSLAFTRALW
jgi:hypothetical protein